MTIPFDPLDHPDAEVTSAYFCQLTGRAKIIAYRYERSDPQWPRPLRRGDRVCCKAGDCNRYLASAQSRADPPTPFAHKSWTTPRHLEPSS